MNDTMKRRLTDQEVHDRVSAYTDNDVVGLWRLLEGLQSQDCDRTNQIDQKASLIIGYAGALIAFISQDSRLHASADASAIALAGAVVAATAAVILASLAYRARAGWAGPTDQNLVPESSQGQCDRYWVRLLRILYWNHVAVNGTKVRRLLGAQVALLVGVTFVAAAALIPLLALG